MGGGISGKNEVTSRDSGSGASRVENPGASSDARRGAAGGKVSGADDRVAGDNLDDMGSGIGAIVDISSSESGSTDSGGTGGSSRSTSGGSNGSSGGGDRNASGNGNDSCHQKDAEAVGDKRSTP